MSDAVLKAISILTDWRSVRTFTCDVRMRQGYDESEFDLHAEPNHSSYVCTERGTGRQFSYNDVTRERNTDGRLETVMPYQLHSEALPARLAFPLSLSIWGRRGDGFRMTDASEVDDRIRVDLVSVMDSDEKGSLMVDSKRRMAVQLDTPGFALHYRSIEFAPNRFSTLTQTPPGEHVKS